MFETTLTVYNSYYDSEAGHDKYSRTIVDGCSWFSRHITGHSGKRFTQENVYKIRIPDSAECEKTYVPPWQYTNPYTQYTLCSGDKIVKGAVYLNMEKDNDLDGKYEICTVKSVSDNRGTFLGHLYVEGS